MGLGQGEGAERFPGQHRGQPARPLLVGAPGDDRVLREDVDRERDGRGHVGRAELLHDERPAEIGEPGPTDRLRDRRRGQPERAHPLEDGPVEALGLVSLDGARRHLSLGELAGGRLEQALLFREVGAEPRRTHFDGGIASRGYV